MGFLFFCCLLHLMFNPSVINRHGGSGKKSPLQLSVRAEIVFFSISFTRFLPIGRHFFLPSMGEGMQRAAR